MPAGLSQITQSNFSRSSAITRATPSPVSASLSRVWHAGSRCSVSSRLSRISACDSLASPWMTLIRSNTTRRSAPMTRSRLRSPTSKSTTTTFSPFCASAGAQGGGRRGLADPAFAGCHDQDLGHRSLPSVVQSSAAITSASPSSQACTARPCSAGSISSAVL